MTPESRKLLRRGLLLALAIGVGVPLYFVGADAWREMRMRLQMREWQSLCMDCNRDDATVVYTDDPTDMASAPGMTPGHFLLEPRGRNHLALEFEPWNRFCNLPDRFSIPLFLHARRASGRQQRLTAVMLAHRWEKEDHPTLLLASTSAQPVTPWSYPELRFSEHTLSLPGLPNSAPVRFCAGQPDPEDDRRFTISFQYGPRSGVLEGHLNEDGTVDLRLVGDRGELTTNRHPDNTNHAPQFPQ